MSKTNTALVGAAIGIGVVAAAGGAAYFAYNHSKKEEEEKKAAAAAAVAAAAATRKPVSRVVTYMQPVVGRPFYDFFRPRRSHTLWGGRSPRMHH